MGVTKKIDGLTQGFIIKKAYLVIVIPFDPLAGLPALARVMPEVSVCCLNLSIFDLLLLQLASHG